MTKFEAGVPLDPEDVAALVAEEAGAPMFDPDTLPKCTCKPSARPADGSHLKGCPDA
jgi:hypothetical protein